MRILFSTTPLDGHFRPLLPLARALAERGHDLAVATARSWHEHVEAEGFDAVAAGADHAAARARRLDGELGSLQTIPGAERRYYVFAYLFAEGHAPLKARELLDAARAWRADAIVYESGDLAAPAVAAALGIPQVHHGFGTMVPLRTLERAGEAVAPVWQQLGLDGARYAGAFRGLYVDVVPPSFAGDRPLGETVRLRPVVGGGDAPEWLDDLPRPLVYATMGTVFNNAETFRPLLEALARAPVGALLTVGRDVDPADLGSAPPNVRIERFVPQAAVLRACDAVVTHGGSGTLLGALAAGVPLVVVPQGANQFENAALAERAGVGLAVPPGADAEAIEAAIRTVLRDPAYRAASDRVRAEIAAMPSPDEVAERVETYVGGG